MTYHAGIHPAFPPLIQSFERIRLISQTLGAVRCRPHEVCVTRFLVNDRAVEPGLMGGGFVLRCQSLHASLSIQFYARTIVCRSVYALPTVKALSLPTR